MPNLLDIAKQLNSVINDNEFSAVISSSEPWKQEIGEEAFEKIKGQMSNLMTFDSAVNNDKIVAALKDKITEDKLSDLRGEAKNSIYTTVEEKMSNLGKKFGLELEGKKFVEQLDEFRNLKLGGGDGNGKEEIEKLHKQLQEKDNAFNEFKTKSENDLTNFKINTKLEAMLSGYNLAEPYQDEFVRKGIYNNIMSELSNKATIKLQGDALIPYQKDNPELEYYEGNKKAEVKDLIEPLISKYVVKSGDKKVTVTPEAKTDNHLNENRSALGEMKKARTFV